MPKHVIIKDRGYKTWLSRVRRYSRNPIEIDVGIPPEDAGKPHPNAEGLTVGALALIHEFGTDRIPERSFLRSTFDSNRRKFKRMLDKAVRNSVATHLRNPQRMMLEAGDELAQDIVAKIESNIPPPLSPVTVARKGHDLALVETGTLKDSIKAVLK